MLVAFFIVFALLQLLVVPIIFKYSRRGVTEWHRPKFGEVAVIAILLTMVAAGLAVFLVKAFSLDRFLEDRRMRSGNAVQPSVPNDEEIEPVVPADREFLPMETEDPEAEAESSGEEPPISPLPTVETTSEKETPDP